MRRAVARMMRSGNVIAYPTESFYALGVDATNPQVIRRLFRLKHREKGKPIALIAENLAQVKKFFVMTPTEERLARKHWPGGLTILLKPKSPIAADTLLGTTPAGHPTGQPSYDRRADVRIGVRVPAQAQARALALKVGAPITATSANRSGRPPTKSTAKVKRNFPGILVVSGRCGRATKPSTVVEVRRNVIHVLRPGSVKIKTQ